MTIFDFFENIYNQSASKDLIAVIIFITIAALAAMYFGTRMANKQSDAIESAGDNATKQVQASTTTAAETLSTLVELVKVMQEPILGALADLAKNISATNINVEGLIQSYSKQQEISEKSLELNQEFLVEIQNLNKLILEALQKESLETRKMLHGELAPINSAILSLTHKIELLPEQIQETLRPALNDITQQMKAIESASTPPPPTIPESVVE